MADETTTSRAHRPAQPQAGPRQSRKARKRVGRGEGSGTGKTSGRGQKGAGSRSGAKDRARFEGGQMPIHMRMRKLRGPHMKKSMPFEPFRTHTQPVNLARPRGALRQGRRGHARGAARPRASATRKGIPVKILAKGELTKPLTVHAHGFSAAAREAHRGRRRHLRRRRGLARSAAVGADAVDDPQRLHRRGDPQEARLHGAAARALPARLAHPRAGGQRPGRRRHPGAVRRRRHPQPAEHVHRRRAVADRALRAGDHALHHGVDHPAAADGRRAVAGEALRRRARSGRRGSRSTRATSPSASPSPSRSATSSSSSPSRPAPGTPVIHELRRRRTSS